VPCGERRAPGRVEQDEQPAGPGDPGELAEPGFGVGQVVDQARRENSVG